MRLASEQIQTLHGIWWLCAACSGSCPHPENVWQREGYDKLVGGGFITWKPYPNLPNIVEVEITAQGLLAVVMEYAPDEYNAARSDNEVECACELAFSRGKVAGETDAKHGPGKWE